MNLSIELNVVNAVKVTEGYPTTGLVCIAGEYDWVPALRAAAIGLQQLNVIAAGALVNGPFACDPDSTIVEGFLGNCNTLPTEFGQVTIGLSNYNQLRLSPQLLMILEPVLLFIAGSASGGVVEEDGSVTQVFVGNIL